MADWKQVVASVAPAIGAALGGPFAGAAVKILADKLAGGSTGDAQQDEVRLSAVLSQGMTPEMQARVLDSDQAYRLALVQAGVETQKVDLEKDRIQAADTAAARAAHAQNQGVMWLGYLINVASYAVVAAVLYGCFELLRGAKLAIDPGAAAVVGSIVGAAVQWVMSNAQQANGFFFGSSPGSRAKDHKLGEAISQASKRG